MKYYVIDGIWVKGVYDTREEAEAHVELMKELNKNYTIEVYNN